MIELICKLNKCKTMFYPHSNVQKYCSQHCYLIAKSERKRKPNIRSNKQSVKKEIKLKCGISVLNNVLGQTMYGYDKV